MLKEYVAIGLVCASCISAGAIAAGVGFYKPLTPYVELEDNEKYSRQERDFLLRHMRRSILK